jgi:hypothetical protein
LAKQLATALSYVHVLDFVHKSIRPETALVFKSHSLDSSSLAHGFGPLFLVGFKTFRTVDGKSLRLTTADRIENIYQHPERQGIDPSTDHRMQHDIYSLGVCLLEIGLWKSFVAGDSSSPILLSELSSVANIKAHFTALAKESLPSAMGEKYTGVVVNCLTCMEPDNVDFGDENEFKDEFGIGIGVKYIEKVSAFYHSGILITIVLTLFYRFFYSLMRYRYEVVGWIFTILACFNLYSNKKMVSSLIPCVPWQPTSLYSDTLFLFKLTLPSVSSGDPYPPPPGVQIRSRSPALT